MGILSDKGGDNMYAKSCANCDAWVGWVGETPPGARGVEIICIQKTVERMDAWVGNRPPTLLMGGALTPIPVNRSAVSCSHDSVVYSHTIGPLL